MFNENQIEVKQKTELSTVSQLARNSFAVMICEYLILKYFSDVTFYLHVLNHKIIEL